MDQTDQQTEAVEEQPEVSLRDDIEAAIAQTESEYAATQEDPASAAPQEPTSEAQASKGEAVPEASAKGSEEASGDATDAGDAAGERSYPDDAERYPNLETKLATAPGKWRPAAREGWQELPEHVRREIHRRELDLDRISRDTSEVRHFHRDIMAALEPHGDMLRREGAATPVDAIKGLVNTAVTLDKGTTAQKAERVAQLIAHYQVDLQTLDSALAAQIKGRPAPSAPANDIERVLEQRLAPVTEFMRGVQERMNAVNAEHAQDAERTVEQFRENAEFLDDVRMDMADMMERAAEQGRELTLQQAYDAACHLNPEIREILARRAAEGAAAASANTVQAKLARSNASLTGRRVGVTPKQSSGSLREDLEAAFDAHNQR